MKLYSYFRSSAAYRLRIALNLKGLSYDYVPVNLLQGEHNSQAYRALNPLGLVPALELPDGTTLGQSVALLEWLEESFPQPPLLPPDTTERARVRALVNTVCCDIHPICNMSVTNYLKLHFDANQDEVLQWYHTWMQRGFTAIEAVIAPQQDFCFGDQPGMADVCLVPQVYNARRFNISLQKFPQLCRVVDNCNQLPAFQRAGPDQQPDCVL